MPRTQTKNKSGIGAFIEVLTGARLKETISEHAKASRRLNRTLNKLSRDEKALIEIDKMLRGGGQNG